MRVRTFREVSHRSRLPKRRAAFVRFRLGRGTDTHTDAAPQGDVLQQEGTPCTHMFCVAQGEVKRYRQEGSATVEVRAGLNWTGLD